MFIQHTWIYHRSISRNLLNIYENLRLFFQKTASKMLHRLVKTPLYELTLTKENAFFFLLCSQFSWTFLSLLLSIYLSSYQNCFLSFIFKFDENINFFFKVAIRIIPSWNTLDNMVTQIEENASCLYFELIVTLP